MDTHWRATAVFFCGAILAATWSSGESGLYAADRAPVPSADAQNAALALVKDTFGDEYAAATSSEQKTAFAQKLLQTAKDTNPGTANHYALLRVAWDVATQASDAKLAIQVTEKIAGAYEVDALKAKVATVTKIAASVRSSAQRKALASVALDLVDEAVAGDDYDRAEELVGLALSAARKAQDWELVKRIVARGKAVKEAEGAYGKVQEALAKLENNPTDPEANQVAGEYLCFRQGDWDKGIPMLALGSDKALTTLAGRDLSGTSDSSEQVALGDGWWDLAGAKEGTERDFLLVRAGYWYRQAHANQPTGLTRAKVEKRLEEIDNLGSPAPKPSTESKSRRRTRPEPHYLTTMQEIDVKMGPWPLGKFGKHGRSVATPIVVNGVAYQFGLGVHPPSRGDSSVKYQLGKKFRRVVTGAALVIGRHTSRSAITFAVLGDGEVLWMSRPTQTEQVQVCDVSVAGVDILELRVQCLGDNHLAQACWLDPYVTESPR